MLKNMNKTILLKSAGKQTNINASLYCVGDVFNAAVDTIFVSSYIIFYFYHLPIPVLIFAFTYWPFSNVLSFPSFALNLYFTLQFALFPKIKRPFLFK